MYLRHDMKAQILEEFNSERSAVIQIFSENPKISLIVSAFHASPKTLSHSH